MQNYYVATLSTAVVVEAECWDEGRRQGITAIQDLFLANKNPTTRLNCERMIQVCRPATEDELRLHSVRYAR